MDISLDWLNKKKPGKTAEFLNLEYVETEGDIYKFKVTFPKETSNPNEYGSRWDDNRCT